MPSSSSSPNPSSPSPRTRTKERILAVERDYRVENKTMTEGREKKPYLTMSPCFGETEEEITVVHQEPPHQISAANHPAEEEEEGAEDDSDSSDDFEFSFAVRGSEAEPSITADEIFSNGRIVPAYPVFDRNLVFSPAAEVDRSSSPSASSETEVVVGEYCAWSRRSAESCKKSASTGSARRWRLRDLMAGRSHSDGKEKFVFLEAPRSTPTPANDKTPKPHATAAKKGGKEGARASELDLVTAHRLYYGKGNAEKMKGGRRSFLPYRQELVGLFATANGFGRTAPPF